MDRLLQHRPLAPKLHLGAGQESAAQLPTLSCAGQDKPLQDGLPWDNRELWPPGGTLLLLPASIAAFLDSHCTAPNPADRTCVLEAAASLGLK